jgi:cold shock protein
LVTGRILQFDHARGYGFVAADDGGEDVFLHASVFDGDADELAPGTKMEFKIMAGDRGRKAFAAHLADDEPDNDALPAPRPVPPSPQVLAPRPGPQGPPVPPVPPPKQDLPKPAPDDEPMCDVLSPEEFGQELTELLLSNIPSLTGQQILEVRKSVLESAKKHGWVDM